MITAKEAIELSRTNNKKVRLAIEKCHQEIKIACEAGYRYAHLSDIIPISDYNSFDELITELQNNGFKTQMTKSERTMSYSIRIEW